MEAGIRELRDHLSRYLEVVRDGKEANDDELVMVTGDSKLGAAAQSIGISVAFTAT